jgi:polyribonucleotide nucleotidyltransferase
MAILTLGTAQDEQRVEALTGETTLRFMLHYNFPPFSVGEVRFLRQPSRREIGHGALADRGIRGIIPPQESFPYTIRIVSEILESNGSSSMATVCASSLAFMDAGVPIPFHVAGVAMGLIKEEENVIILTDILGDEDHLGDMDFKVVGNREGVSAVQMDVKLKGLGRDVLMKAMEKARAGRFKVLDAMEQTLSQPRKDLSPWAPRIYTTYINPERIKDLIGPGGKIIRSIIEKTGVAIDVHDDGRVNVASVDEKSANEAMELVRYYTEEAQINKIYRGVVTRVMDFGAFVEILPGTEGLVHISELSDRRVQKVHDVVQEGDEIMVKVIDIDRQGKIRLSRREALARPSSPDDSSQLNASEGEHEEAHEDNSREEGRDRHSERPQRSNRGHPDSRRDQHRSDHSHDRRDQHSRGERSDRGRSGGGKGGGSRYDRDRRPNRDHDHDRPRQDPPEKKPKVEEDIELTEFEE